MKQKGTLEEFVKAKKLGMSDLAKWTLMKSAEEEINEIMGINNKTMNKKDKDAAKNRLYKEHDEWEEKEFFKSFMSRKRSVLTNKIPNNAVLPIYDKILDRDSSINNDSILTMSHNLIKLDIHMQKLSSKQSNVRNNENSRSLERRRSDTLKIFSPDSYKVDDPISALKFVPASFGLT